MLSIQEIILILQSLIAFNCIALELESGSDPHQRIIVCNKIKFIKSISLTPFYNSFIIFVTDTSVVFGI